MLQPFHFKQFTVQQDRCAMKIGTDGVLLGAWVSLRTNPNSILDIGAGTGILSLQLAQRNNAQTLDAIEIDENAFEQCIDNFENSPWADRLFCYHASAQEFALEMDEKYDLIISNPPFYSEDYKSKNEARDMARFNDALPFEHLVGVVQKLLSKNGIFALILPRNEEENFIELAFKAGLFPNKICRVRGTPVSEEKRSLIEFSFNKTTIEMEFLTLEISRHQYTKEYKRLVEDFYLKM